jgi:ubiquinone/menaquinone biosynthesis C-methylase UbiE
MASFGGCIQAIAITNHFKRNLMDNSEFDKFADEYYSTLSSSISASGETPEYYAEYKIHDIFSEYCFDSNIKLTGSLNILDFGVGNGGSIPYVKKYFPEANLTGLDVSLRCLEVAEKRFPSLARYIHFDGIHIPFATGNFDIIYAACVFHHIDHAEHIQLLEELHRVLRPSGYLFVFEHNPYNPLTVRVVNNCPFDENAKLIKGSMMKKRVLSAGFGSAKIQYRIFFPHFLRILRPLEMAMKWLPLGAQYYICARK